LTIDEDVEDFGSSFPSCHPAPQTSFHAPGILLFLLLSSSLRGGNGQVQDVGQNQRTARAAAAGQEGILRVGPTNLFLHVSFLKIVT